MNKPQIFNHQSFGNLPVIVIDGAEWFGATEAAKALGFSNPHKAVDHHVENDDCTVHTVIDSLGRTQQKKFINESGIYSLIFGAAKQGNNPEIQEKARQFKRWVTSEVLPSIRRTGSYALQPMTTAEMIAAIANQAVEQERRLAAVEKRLDDTAEILALNPTEWRRKTTALLNKIAK
ncbi:BRO family protein, partial [Paenibacillus cisolokensis]|uniref:BRO-N domain-containing protein n=1 Tax=Paenibacillus cisolokensis TaxID=1658519 RepID=UPI003D28629E